MQSTGKEYKDHASTIMTWYLKDKKKENLGVRKPIQEILQIMKVSGT